MTSKMLDILFQLLNYNYQGSRNHPFRLCSRWKSIVLPRLGFERSPYEEGRDHDP